MLNDEWKVQFQEYNEELLQPVYSHYSAALIIIIIIIIAIIIIY